MTWCVTTDYSILVATDTAFYNLYLELTTTYESMAIYTTPVCFKKPRQ